MSSSRRKSWFAALALPFYACGPSAPPKPEHIVLIVIDTLRADHLGCFDYARADNSPTLDALAKEGVLFKNAISQSSFTSPSMVSLMSGHYIAKERLDIPAELPTLAESFQRAGWKTGAFITNDLLSEENGFARGFKRFEAIADYGSNEPIERWFRDVAGSQSFTYIHIKEPHEPYDTPGGPHTNRERADLLPGDRAEFYARVGREMQLHDNDANVSQIKQEIGGYDDDVRYADARVAKFLAALEASGLRSKTALIVTADHGQCLWERVALMSGQRGAKLRAGEPPTLTNTLMPTHGNQVSHELVHVPLILVVPGAAKNESIDAPVENVDLFPTLLELADLASPGGLQGTSLLPWLAGSQPASDFAFSFTRFNSTVITADGMQLVLPTDEGECSEALVPELYDLKSDPYQRHNLAAQKPELVERSSKLAHERLKIAIHTAGSVSAGDLTALNGLGYTDQVAREETRRTLAAMPAEELLKRATAPNAFCVERLAIAESLATRQLDDAAKATLRAWRAKETAGAVQRVLDELLAK